VIISLALKATALVLVGLASARLARRSRASVRHAILVATFAALAALPIATASLPTLSIEVPVGETATSIARAEALAFTTAPPARVEPEGQAFRPGDKATVEGPGFSRGLASVAMSLWLAGVVAFLIPLVAGVWRVRRLRREALPAIDMQRALARLAAAAGVRRDIDLSMHEELAAPITCGIARAAIVVPPDAGAWSDAALRRALVHELEHVRRRDWITQLFARLVCAAYWFHPLAWVAYRQLCLEAEHACDDAVVSREEGTSYADQLVSLARRMAARPEMPVPGMAHRSDLSARISAILDATKVRGRTGAVRAIVIAVIFSAVMTALAPLQVSAVASAPVASSPTSTEQQPRRVRVRWLDRALVEAADEGDLGGVRELLDQGADVNAAVDGDGSALIVAAREGYLQLVRLLLDRGADVNLAVSGDGAPLIMAAREGHLAIVRLLLDRGAEIDLIVPADENALIQASGSGQLAVVQLLVSRGANVNARAWADSSARLVFEAAKLVEKVGAITVRGTRGGNIRIDGSVSREAGDQAQGEWRTPLNMAQRGGHRAVVAFLQSAGAIE
jgi:bla regulator protein blaR1